MRSCPRCHNLVYDGMSQCFECMYSFKDDPAEVAAQGQKSAEFPVDSSSMREGLQGGGISDEDITLVEYLPRYGIELRRVDGSVEHFMLNESGLQVGRSPSCDIVLTDPTVSRDHLRLYMLHGKVLAEDRNATNPSMIDHIPLKGCVEIEVGQTIDVRGVNLILKSL